MDFFNIDSIEIRQSPTEVRFKSIQVEPFSDGKRVHVKIHLTPFQRPPCLELSLEDPNGNEASSVSIIEPPHWIQELTMHIRISVKPPGRLILNARLFYPDIEGYDSRSVEIMVPEATEDQF